MAQQKSDWLCINCGERLGGVFGGELTPAVPSIRTSGPNLVVTCPKCGAVKVWYTADPIVKAVYQLVNAVTDVAASAMVAQLGKAIHSGDLANEIRQIGDK